MPKFNDTGPILSAHPSFDSARFFDLPSLARAFNDPTADFAHTLAPSVFVSQGDPFRTRLEEATPRFVLEVVPFASETVRGAREADFGVSGRPNLALAGATVTAASFVPPAANDSLPTRGDPASDRIAAPAPLVGMRLALPASPPRADRLPLRRPVRACGPRVRAARALRGASPIAARPRPFGDWPGPHGAAA